ncbi:MAG: hypothetical protein KJ968_04150 [Nanoarchaeota archaeon]|nr:hypothetical protein [Nanoarchaeota archaeon]
MEDLVINLKEKCGLIPEVLGYLASIKEFEYSYKYYHLRHPGGIFNLATNYVLNDFIGLLKDLEENQQNYDKDRKIELEEKFQNLINDFFKFCESCFEIIQGCCKQHSPPNDNEFLWKWLEKNKYEAGKEIYNKTEDDLEYFRKIYNKLKHSSNALQPVIFHLNKSAIMGYYVQAVADDGSLGPDEDLHPKHQGTHSASSYNFNLRKLYYCIYKISNILKKVILIHFKEVYSIDLDFNANYKTDDKLWNELFERINKLPKTYFPNEFGKDICDIQKNDDKLIFTIKPTEHTNLFGSQITFLESGDGFTRSYRMPFFNPKY